MKSHSRMEAPANDVIKVIKRYQHCIQQINPVESDPQRVLHYMRKLSKLPIRLEELEKTGIGKTINAFRKLDGNIAEEATLLVAKWKANVKKQMEELEPSDLKADPENDDRSGNNSCISPLPMNNCESVKSEYDASFSLNDRKHDKNKVRLITIKREGSDDRKRKHSEDRTKKEKLMKVEHPEKGTIKKEPVDRNETDRESVDKKRKDSEKKKDLEKRHHKSSKHEKSHRESKREEKHRHHEKKHESDRYDSKHRNDKKSKTRDKEVNHSKRDDRKSSKEVSDDGKKSRHVDKSEEASGDFFGAALLGIPVTASPKKKSISSRSSDQDSPPPFSSPKSNQSLEFLSNNIKLEPLSKDLDISDIQDYAGETYKTPTKYSNNKHDEHMSPSYSQPQKPSKPKALSEEDMFSSMTSMKNRRTKVYHGFKVNSKFPTLFELCVRILQDNFDALEYTGGVPYEVLKPILEKVTVEQLYTFENFNPYLIGETDELWEHHAKKDFRKAERQEYETWRDLYLRCVEEREEKLQSLTVNISQSMAMSTPVRKTKLAYVDAIVKPPRNVARQQAKHGTGNSNSVSRQSPKEPQPSPSAIQSVKERLAKEASSPNAIQIPTKAAALKKKSAPLMQKTLQLFKGLKR